MLGALVSFSLRYRAVVVVLTGVLLGFGIWDSMRSPLDVFPEFAPPLVDIQVECPGMSSEAVEQLVTIHVESAVNGMPHMTTLRSKSVQGLCQVVIIFEPGTNLFNARQMADERMATVAARLPQQCKRPHVLPPLSSTSRALHIGLAPTPKDKLKDGAKALDQTDVSVAMKWIIEPRLLAVPGVANVSTYGLQHKQYQVLFKPEDLRDRGVTLEQVKAAVKQGAVYASAGYHDTPNQRLAIQYTTRITKAEDLGATVVGYQKGQPVRLSEVATITTGNPPFIGEGVINDEAGLLVVVEKFPWANTLDVTYEVEKVMENLKPSLPGMDVAMHIFRPATFIELALKNLRYAMILGCVLVTLILIAFLFEWRTAVISLTAIPLSLIGALLILNRFGGTLNTMVLAGLAIAVGEVVDDAIIDVENILRRLRQNAALGHTQSNFRVVFNASMEVRSAVVYASFIVAFVCLPIFFLGGVAGSFFRPLATAYILAILVSLLVALTVTPALSLWLLPGAVKKSADSPVVRGIRAVYRRILPVGLNRPYITFATLGLLFVGAIAVWTQLKEEYLPVFQENDFLMHWIAKPGTSIDVLRDDIKIVSKEMRSAKLVDEFGSHIARAEAGEEVVGPNFAELWISMSPNDDYVATKKKIEDVMAQHPGFQHDLLTYLQERVKEVLSGSGASIVMRIYGHDLAKLRAKAAAVKKACEKVEGVKDLKVEAQVLVPQLELTLDPHAISYYGLTPGAVLDATTTIINGTKVGEVHFEQKAFDIVVWGHPDIRKSLPQLGQLPIDLPGGKGTVPLEALGQIRLVNAPNAIRHDKASRCIDVTCNFSGRDLGSVMADIHKVVDPLQEAGYRIEFLGEYQARTENQRQLMAVSLLAMLGIALMLYVDFKSVKLTALVFVTLMFAPIGGIVAAYMTGAVLSLGSLVGFICVFGIAARNGIMLVSHYRHLETEEGVPFGRELILQGAAERVGPILMTALAAGLGLLPLAISGSKPGYEVEYPMAVVILGGLFTSTLLNLLVLPVLYERFGRVSVVAEEAV